MRIQIVSVLHLDLRNPIHGRQNEKCRYMSRWARPVDATVRGRLDQRRHLRRDPSRPGYTLGTYLYMPSVGRSSIKVRLEDGNIGRYAMPHLCLETGPRAGCQCRGRGNSPINCA